MTTKEWDTIQIEDISLTDNTDIVFLRFKTKEDVSKFTSKARHLPKDQGADGPRLIMYVDSRAMKRHKAILSIARTIREHSDNTLQTSIRTGKHNFLIRSREKGSDTPWSEIAPIKITQDIPEFEIGTYHDIVNPDNNVPEDMEEEHVIEEQVEDIHDIIEDVARQNTLEDNNKRDTTNQDTSHGKKKVSRKASDITMGSESTESSSGEDEDDDSVPKKVLNSTPNPLNPPIRKINTLDSNCMEDRPKEIQHYFSEGQSHQWRVQPDGISRQPSIPELPEPIEDKQVPSPSRKQKTHDDRFNDDQIIHDLTHASETIIQHHG